MQCNHNTGFGDVSLYPETETEFSESIDTRLVSFVTAPPAKVIPQFLELARQKRMQQVRSLAQAMAQSAKKTQECEINLRELEREIVANPHQAIALKLDKAHQRALIQTWEMRRDMASEAMRSIGRRLAA
jgi:hypothetical protein